MTAGSTRPRADDVTAAASTGAPIRPAQRLEPLWRAAAALASGAVQLLALPPYDLWWLAPLSAALLLLAVYGTRVRRAAWLGLLSGAALMVPLVRWQDVFGTDVWLLISAAETVYFVPLAMGIAMVLRLPGWVFWTSALWVAEELVRSRWPLGGFPWGKLAFSQPDTPFTGYAAWGSSPLVTFMVALAGALLALAVLRLARLGERRLRAVGTAAASVAAILAIGAVGAFAPRLGAPSVDHTVTAAIVQGNVPGTGQVHIAGERRQVLDNHVGAVHELAARVRAGEVAQPDLVILPENASDIDPYTSPLARRLIQQAAADVGAPMLVGISRWLPDDKREVRAVVWDPRNGAGDYYVKRYLVPFGEYIPFRDFFTSFVSRLQQVGSDAVPGTEPGNLRMGATTIATAICFDVAFDLPLRESVRAGGQILVVPTNNANYNFTGQSDQQLAITQLRAVEHGRPALVASTSGISAVISKDGSVAYQSPEAERAIHVAEVPAMSGLTVADRVGAGPEWALALAGLAGVAGAWILRRGDPGNERGARSVLFGKGRTRSRG